MGLLDIASLSTRLVFQLERDEPAIALSKASVMECGIFLRATFQRRHLDRRMVTLVLACDFGVVALLDVDRRCNGPLSSSTPRVRMLYHATVVVPLSSLISWVRENRVERRSLTRASLRIATLLRVTACIHFKASRVLVYAYIAFAVV